MADPRRRGGREPSEEELQTRRVRLAKGDSPADIAKDWGRAPGTIYQQAHREKELIAAIREAGLEALRISAGLVPFMLLISAVG